ncbi:efflux RND transporter periplasmic adaptor subunit [Terasakiella sp. A23]|uniref:efflux RND transporter periplasmic adaptor subunit n=1 Tax=Terasakiella sp. FCG-A23 TaxID=3080561 RepID=UPI0029549D86|nr:efflux RND transporter periplasmic adaptor subunit [Terasakiella sp. A23]MDV7340344.1 efflux RND transporter periplasmic adaptor subunit [Terasakiella sp. A23]
MSAGQAQAQEPVRPQARALIEAVDQAVLSAELPGKIISFPFQEGEVFKKGDLLIGFDCRSFKAQLAVETAGLIGAQKKLANLQRLFKLGSASQLDIDLAEAAVQRSQGLQKQAKVLTQQCQIKAPFSGKVVQRVARLHESKSPGDPIIEILNHQKLEIKLVVPSSWLRWMKVGQPFQVKIDETGQIFKAEIVRIGARIDAVSQTINVMGVPKDANDLLPGMSGNALFSLTPEN